MPTILLIEDDPAVSQVIVEHLSEAGFAISSESDTSVALANTEVLERADLLLVDLVMPTGQPNGLEFATAARAKVPDLPIIFITGYYGFVARAGTLPGTVLYKPVDLEALTHEINSSLGL
jgi:CheY-like chemotaxis protein